MEYLSRLWLYSPGLVILSVILLGFFSFQLGRALMLRNRSESGP